MTEPLVETQKLNDLIRGLQPLFNASADELVAQAKGSVSFRRRASGLLETHIPFFLEAHELKPKREDPNGEWVHGYDEKGRLLLVEHRRDCRVMQYGETITEYFTSEHKGVYKIARVGQGGALDNGLHYYVTTDRYDQSHAYTWRTISGRVVEMHSGVDSKIVVEAEYDEQSNLVILRRNGKEIVKPKPASRQSLPLAVAARLVRDLCQKAASLTDEVPILFTVCVEWRNPKSLPPQIGVVFERDAEAFIKDPAAYADGPNALLQPTLQEDYDFPTKTSYPFVEIRDDAISADWDEASMMDRSLKLVDELNALRSPGDPPFLLVDMENEGTRYLDHLPRADRERLASYGIADT